MDSCPLDCIPELSAPHVPAPPLPPPPQTFLLWLCTFHTNVVTCWLFFSLAILFWLLVRAARLLPAGWVPGDTGWLCTLLPAAGGSPRLLSCCAVRLHAACLGCLRTWPCRPLRLTQLLLAGPFALQAGGVGPSEERVTLTKVAGGWGFMVAAVAFYDGEPCRPL